MERSYRRQFVPPEDVDVPAARDESVRRLKSRFEHVYDKYGRSFSGVGDEIDLATGRLIVDNGHLERMTGERDDGVSRRLYSRNSARAPPPPRHADDGDWESMPEGDGHDDVVEDSASDAGSENEGPPSLTSSQADDVEDRIGQLGQTIAAGIADILSLRGLLGSSRKSKRDRGHSASFSPAQLNKRRHSSFDAVDNEAAARSARRRRLESGRSDSRKSTHARHQNGARASSPHIRFDRDIPRRPDSRHDEDESVELADYGNDSQGGEDYESAHEVISSRPQSRLQNFQSSPQLVRAISGHQERRPLTTPAHRESERLQTPQGSTGVSIWDPEPSPGADDGNRYGNGRNPVWTKEEDSLLAQLRLDGLTWADIAPRMSGRSQGACNVRWSTTIRDRLHEYTDRELDESARSQIAAAAAASASRKQARSQAYTARAPTCQWTDQETADLLQMRNVEGLSWSEIERRMPEKPARALKLHYLEVNGPVSLDERRPWTSAETLEVIGFKQNGLSLSQIGALIGRSANAAKCRLVRFNKGELDLDDTPSAAKATPTRPFDPSTLRSPDQPLMEHDSQDEQRPENGHAAPTPNMPRTGEPPRVVIQPPPVETPRPAMASETEAISDAASSSIGTQREAPGSITAAPATPAAESHLQTFLDSAQEVAETSEAHTLPKIVNTQSSALRSRVPTLAEIRRALLAAPVTATRTSAASTPQPSSAKTATHSSQSPHRLTRGNKASPSAYRGGKHERAAHVSDTDDELA